MHYISYGRFMAQNTFSRCEKKMLANISDLPEITETLLRYMRRDNYNSGGRPYRIDNVYLDNDNDDIIRHSVQKPPYKEKLRIRCYGPLRDGDKIFLEIKRKAYGVGNKRRAALYPDDLYRYLEDGLRPEYLSYIDRQVLNETDYFLKSGDIYPKVWLSYMRYAYFGIDDPLLRVTIDSDILTRRNDLDIRSGRYGSALLPEGKCLIEVKFTGAVPLWFSEMMSETGIRFSTFSKYGNEYCNRLLDRKNTPYTV